MEWKQPLTSQRKSGRKIRDGRAWRPCNPLLRTTQLFSTAPLHGAAGFQRSENPELQRAEE